MEIFIIIVMFLLTVLSAGIALAFFLEILGWAWTGAPYVPIPKKAFEKLPEALQLKDSSAVYDLGCGDGRVLFELAKKYPKTQFVGIEKAPLPYFLAAARSLFAPQKNVRIVLGDIYTTPLSDATHVYVYLFTELMHKLEPVLQEKLRPGTRVVSCDFQFKGHTPTHTLSCGTKNNEHFLRVYDF